MFLLTIALAIWSVLEVTPTPGRPDSLQNLLVNAGRALNLREYAKARDYYDAAYQLDSNNVEVLRNLAILHTTVGDHPNALKLLLRAEQLAPEDPSVCNNLGTTYSVLNQPDKAVIYFERAHQLKPKNATYMTNLGLEYAKLGKMPQAMELAKQAIVLDTVTADIPIILGDCFSLQRQYDSADFYYSRAIALGGKTAKLFYQRGFARQNLKRSADAETDYRAAIQRDSTCRDCRQGLGVLFVTQGKYSDALEQFSQVVKLDSMFNPGWVSLGVMYAMTGQGEKADSVLYKLMAKDTTLGYRMVDLINLENSKQQKKK